MENAPPDLVISDQFGRAQAACGYILQTELPVRSPVLEGEFCYVPDWCSEPLPLENENGNSMSNFVSEIILESTLMKKKWATPVSDVAPPPKEDILIFPDKFGFCKRVMDLVPESRVGKKKYVSGDLDVMDEDDIKQLLTSQTWDLVIYGAPLDPPKSNDVMAVLAQNGTVTRTYLYVCKAIAMNESVRRLAVLCRDTFSETKTLHKEVGLGLITNGNMFGMTNSVRLEINIPMQYIDIEYDLGKDLEPLVMSEIFRRDTFGQNSVRISNPYRKRKELTAGRYVMRHIPSAEYKQAAKLWTLPRTGVIAISGGNGALGLVMGKWLMSKAKEQQGWGEPYELTIKFLSRSTKISDQNMPNWEDIQSQAEELGISVEQSKSDWGTLQGAHAFIQENTPNIAGIIHSAGTLQDSMLYNQTWEKYETVFDGKHRAATWIHDALEKYKNPKLAFYWMFSSASVWGNMGQTNYSGSNSFMDALARHRNSRGLPATAMQWAAWGEVGMAANMDDAQRRRMAYSPMPYFMNWEGLAGMESGLASGVPYFTVMKVNPGLFWNMISNDQSHTACYTRNWNCEIVPTPPPGALDRNNPLNLYQTFRMFRYIMNPYTSEASERLTYNQVVLPRIKAA